MRFFSNQVVKLMKGKALRKHSLHEKTEASVLLKLFISSKKQFTHVLGYKYYYDKHKNYVRKQMLTI